MIKQMVRLWIAIPIIMFLLVMIGLVADFTWRMVEQNHEVFGVIVLTVSLAGLIAATERWLKSEDRK